MSEKSTQDFSGTERYRVVRQIGAGGMGVVYEAHDQERNARVALKTLPRVDPMALYRFKQEFRSLADVVHPNLVALYQLIAVGEQWFFTMEFVNGCNFLEYVRGSSSTISPETNLSVDVNPRQAQGETQEYSPSTHHPADVDRPDAPSSAASSLSPEQHDRLRAALRQLAAGVCALHEAG